MKKLLYMGIALFAFISGIFVFYVRPLFMPVPLKEVARKLNLYNSREIKVKGFFVPIKLQDSSITYLFLDYANDCNKDSEYCISEAEVEFSKELKGYEAEIVLSKEVEDNEAKLIEDLLKKNSEYEIEKKENTDGSYGVGVEIIGNVEEEKRVFEDFRIKVKELKQITPIKLFTTHENLINTK